jgi:hypothetical protein
VAALLSYIFVLLYLDKKLISVQFFRLNPLEFSCVISSLSISIATGQDREKSRTRLINDRWDNVIWIFNLSFVNLWTNIKKWKNKMNSQKLVVCTTLDIYDFISTFHFHNNLDDYIFNSPLSDVTEFKRTNHLVDYFWVRRLIFAKLCLICI